jgi:hypothetical protein
MNKMVEIRAIIRTAMLDRGHGPAGRRHRVGPARARRYQDSYWCPGT